MSERYYINYVEGRNYGLVASYNFMNPNMTKGLDSIYDNGGFRLFSSQDLMPNP